MVEKNKINRKILKIFLACIALVLCLAMLSGCSATVIVGIRDVEINEDGELIVNYTNGKSDNLGVVVGEDGEDGKDGKDGEDFTASVENVYNNSITIEGVESNVSAAAKKGIGSAVSIAARGPSSHSFGSGVIYKLDKEQGDAFIITNYHVVYSETAQTYNKIAEDIVVYLYGSETYSEDNDSGKITATYVGGSKYYDIAVLRVENSAVLRSSEIASEATFADSSSVAVGDTAIAIGNPSGGGLSVSCGVVSIDSEFVTIPAIGNTEYVSMRLMRVDTSVNPGNSGGGLFDAEGNVIGIVNAKIVAEDVDSIGYAIPSRVAVGVAENIIDNCYRKEAEAVQKCLVGVNLGYDNLHAVFDEESGEIRRAQTVYAETITEGGAAVGKIMEGDIFKSIKIGNKTYKIEMFYDITEAMLDARLGDTITFELLRNEEPITVEFIMTQEYITEY